MKKFNSIALLESLQADTRALIARVMLLQNEDPGVLLKQPAAGQWSVIQIIEHLNSYSDYYLPALEKSLQADKPARQEFVPGWFGNYFTKLMAPSADGTVKNKMKAFKNHRPSFHADAQPVIGKFIQQQHTLLELLEKAKTKDIGSIRTPISISRLIRLKAGDTFRFLIAHEQRHFVQLENTLAAIGKQATGISPTGHLAV